MSEGIKSAIQKTMDEMMALVAAGDYKKVADECYEEKCVLITPDGKLVEGRVAMVAELEKWDPKGDPWELSLDDVQGEGCWAYVRGSFKTKKMAAKFVTIYKKTGDKYRIYSDIFSVCA